jgi:hypothetical protein
MKIILWVAVVLMFATRLPAQTNQPVRLAVIAESDAAANAADLLTAQLSGDDKIHLLERNEIQRVYREQALSASGRDEVKLGRILGADGLLLLKAVNKSDANAGGAPARPVMDLTMRLIAVKPGVVLASESFTLPQSELGAWTSSFAPHLEEFLPKLTVLERDAVPVSIVSFRSAIQSDEGKATERQVKSLTIQRLSEERRLFVLERQRMELLAEEKGLKSDESPFWNGSYLVECALDQNGYSKETITLNARMTPPKGGAPLTFEVTGARTNLAELVNQLAEKLDESLKIQSTVKSWNAADEARQYLEEAKWALRWEVYVEAQMASESAWALGKRDLDCALVRIKSYVLAVPSVAAAGVTRYKHWKKVAELHLNERPDPKECAAALYALQCYDEFARSSPEGEPRILSRGKGGNDWHNSDWYQLGIDALEAVSGVLQHFNRFPEAQKPVADQLAEMRALARSVAALISKSPTVHDSYFVGGRVVTHDELGHTMDEHPNIFRCKVDWGCYWQETPEDTIAMYRQLMSSPVFCYLHQHLWLRPPERPRLVAWNEEDRRGLRLVWDKFVAELKNSSDVNLQLEADAFAVADAGNEQKLAVTFTNFFNNLMANRDTLVTNHVEVLYLDWRAGALVPGNGAATPLKESLRRLYQSEYWPKLEAMDQDYWRNTIPASQTASASQNPDNLQQFEKQKQYLKENTPFEPNAFVHMFIFGFKNYSKAQALEIQPLLAAYKTNLDEQVKENNTWARIGVMQVGQAEANVNRILNATEKPPQPPATLQPSHPPAVAKASAVAAPAVPAPASAAAEEMITHVLTVDKFLAIPLADLHTNEMTTITITAHHWVEDKLLLDFNYDAPIAKFDTNGNWQGTRWAHYPGIAILNPQTQHWDVASGPEQEIMAGNHFYHRSTLWRGELFNCDANRIQKYDFQTKAWKALEISDGGSYELFAIGGHLYAANESTVFEITEDGKHTRLMASSRRQPPVSALDTEDLGTPALFEGPDHLLRLATSRTIFTWMGADWRKVLDTPGMAIPPALFPHGILFMTAKYNEPTRLFRLATESDTAELCLQQEARPPIHINNFRPAPETPQGPEPKWKLPPTLPLGRMARASRQSDLFLLADHSDKKEIIDEKQHLILGTKVVTRGGCHAELLCFCAGSPSPLELFLKFDAANGRPPVPGDHSSPGPGLPMTSPAWMFFAGDYLVFGLESAQNLISSQTVLDTNGYMAGVWLMPMSQLEPAIAEQKRARIGQESHASGAPLRPRPAGNAPFAPRLVPPKGPGDIAPQKNP